MTNKDYLNLSDDDYVGIFNAVDDALEKYLRPKVNERWLEVTKTVDADSDLAANLATTHLPDETTRRFSRNEAREGAHVALTISAVDRMIDEVKKPFFTKYQSAIAMLTEALESMFDDVLTRLVREKLAEYQERKN